MLNHNVVFGVDSLGHSSLQITVVFLSLLDCSCKDSVLSGVRGSISKLMPEQHNHHL